MPELAKGMYLGVEFQAMNTQIAAIGRTYTPLTYWQRAIIQQFVSLEKSASRFLKDSELSQLNCQPLGTPLKVTLSFFHLLRYAWKLAIQTNFKFQPFVGSALQQNGYDRSFELLNRPLRASSEHVILYEDIPRAPDDLPTVPNDLSIAANNPSALEFDEESRTVRKNCSLDLDLGGVGKGWTVDRAVSIMRDTFHLTAGMVDAGGDLQVWSDGAPWCIGIQDPENEEKEVLQLWVKNAGIATSNMLFRRWEREGQHYHHIIDGHSLTCAHSDIVQVTVVAPTIADQPMRRPK